MGGRHLEGPTMVGRTLDWNDELGRWLKPFVDRLGHRARRRMCPLYVSGLIGPGDRKSVQPMAKRLVLGEYDQLHHFIAAGVWEASPVETELLVLSLTAKAAPMSPPVTPLKIWVSAADQLKQHQAACYSRLFKESANCSTS